MRTSRHDLFTVEPLEPRLLLSGDAAVAAAAPGLSSLPDSGHRQVVEIQAGEDTAQAPCTSDTQAQLADLFGSADTPEGVREVTAEVCPTSPDPVAAECVRDGDWEGLPAAPAHQDTVADELVETLHAANGPPADSVALLEPIGDGGQNHPSPGCDSGGVVWDSSGVVTGSGTITGSVVNPGVVSPGNSPGIINIDGDYSMGTLDEVEIEIEGPDPGTGYDQLNITGILRCGIDGLVKIQFILGTNPAELPQPFECNLYLADIEG